MQSQIGVQRGVYMCVCMCKMRTHTHKYIYISHMQAREMHTYTNMRNGCVHTWGHEGTHVCMSIPYG